MATWFDQDHRVVRTYPAPPVHGRGLIVRHEEGALLLPRRSETHHLVRIDSTGSRRTWGKRAEARKRLAPDLPGRMTQHLLVDLIEPLGQDVILLDGESGSLLRFGHDGSVHEAYALPISFVEEYFPGTGVVDHEDPGSGRTSIDFRLRFADFSVGSVRRMVFIRPGAPTDVERWVGGVVDLAGGVLFPLVSDVGNDPMTRLSLRAVVVLGDELVLGALDGSLFRVRLEVPET